MLEIIIFRCQSSHFHVNRNIFFLFQGKDSKAVPFTVFGVLAIVCALLMVFLPETTHTPLSDLLKYDTSVYLTEQSVDVPLTPTQTSVESEETQPSEDLQPLAGTERETCAGESGVGKIVA